MDGLDLGQVKTFIIRPVLALLPARWSGETAENLLAGTFLVESGGRYVHQLGAGPAVGPWEMEPVTHDDCWATFLDYPAQADLAAAIRPLVMDGLPRAQQMAGNFYYACAMARVKYIRAPEALPAANDALALAEYHKRWYNTAGGATVVAESEKLFAEAIAA